MQDYCTLSGEKSHSIHSDLLCDSWTELQDSPLHGMSTAENWENCDDFEVLCSDTHSRIPVDTGTLNGICLLKERWGKPRYKQVSDLPCFQFWKVIAAYISSVYKTSDTRGVWKKMEIPVACGEGGSHMSSLYLNIQCHSQWVSRLCVRTCCFMWASFVLNYTMLTHEWNSIFFSLTSYWESHHHCLTSFRDWYLKWLICIYINYTV